MFVMLCLIPVIPLYQSELGVHSEWLVGLAIGCYGLTQAFMQLIMGYLSDHYGRLKIIRLGLFVFMIGSFIPLFYHHIYAIIAARFLQGLGAIGAVATAWAQESLPLNKRPIAMAIIGIGIGLCFMTSFSVGTWVAQQYGLASLMTTIAIMSSLLWLVSLTYSAQTLPSSQTSVVSRLAFANTIVETIKHKHYRLFFYMVFVLHMLFASHFCIVPLELQAHNHSLASTYFGVFILSYVCALPMFRYFKQHLTYSLPTVLSVCLLIVGYLLFYQDSQWEIFSLILFFCGFNILEALLPTWITGHSKSTSSGVRLGLFYAFQYLGIFVGGLIGGWLLELSDTSTPTNLVLTTYIIIILLPGLYWLKPQSPSTSVV